MLIEQLATSQHNHGRGLQSSTIRITPLAVNYQRLTGTSAAERAAKYDNGLSQ
jgi:hypothetical protein